MNPLAFILGSGLLGGTNFQSVRDLIVKQGATAAKNFLNQQAKSMITAHSVAIAQHMVNDGWKVGGTDRHGHAIDQAAMVHDVMYRIVAVFVSHGGFVKDQVRDGIDHAIGATLAPTAPTIPDAQWVKTVGNAMVDHVF